MKYLMLILAFLVVFEAGIIYLIKDTHKYDMMLFNSLWHDCTTPRK